MALPLIPVAIATQTILGAALANGYATFELTRADVYAGFVVPQQQTVQLAADGTGSAQFFPNVLCTQQTQYLVKLYSWQGVLQLTGYATLPNAPCNLHDVLTLTPATLDAATLTAIAAQAAAVAARSYANLVLVGL
ncbi:MAG: hypothetical protein JWQ72_3201 [Polaromonas sp.]|nr:hypothetical protein [Polaromonas sp.]